MKGRWSYIEQRGFVEIAASSKSFDEVVKRTRRRPVAVRRLAIRLGIRLGEQIASDNRLEAALRAKK